VNPDNPPFPDAQLMLEGIEPSVPSDRLFFAVFPDPAIAVDVTHLAQTLRREHALHGKPVRTGRMHITLHFLGDYVGLPQDLVASAKLAAGHVEAHAFDVLFDSVASFSRGARNHPLVLRGTTGLQSLQAFQRRLGECLALVGLNQFLNRKFVPHMTLLYDNKLLKAQSTEPISWRVREFILVHSLLGRTEHVVLGRWPLQSET
jgi:RNA 2',3'-cyclic 3'-phosphodiesterase